MFRFCSFGIFLSAVISASNPRGRREPEQFAVPLAVPAHPLGAAEIPGLRKRTGQGIREVLIQQDLHPDAG